LEGDGHDYHPDNSPAKSKSAGNKRKVAVPKSNDKKRKKIRRKPPHPKPKKKKPAVKRKVVGRKNTPTKQKRKPQVRPFHSEALMPHKAITHEIVEPGAVYLCYDKMATAYHIFASPDTTMIGRMQKLHQVITDLAAQEVIAISGHVLGYSSTMEASVFNEWVATWMNFYSSNSGEFEVLFQAKLMYIAACDCRLIIEGDFICTHKSMQNESVEVDGSTVVESNRIGSRSKYQSIFDRQTYYFDTAKNALSHQAVPTAVGESLNPKQTSAKLVERRKHLRAETLHIVLNKVLLRYQHVIGFDIGPKESLLIAGYPGIGHHKLNHKYQDTVSMRKILEPPVNMETLFARTQSAVGQCMDRAQSMKNLRNHKIANITRADATRWREDPHLQKYKIPCLFRRTVHQIEPSTEREEGQLRAFSST